MIICQTLTDSHHLRNTLFYRIFCLIRSWTKCQLTERFLHLSLCKRQGRYDAASGRDALVCQNNTPSIECEISVRSVMSSELAEIQGILDSTQSSHSKQMDVTPSSRCCISGSSCRSAEMGYMNLTSTQSLPDHSASFSTESAHSWGFLSAP